MTGYKQYQPQLLVARHWQDYELLDTGEGKRLERYGRFRFIRPEPQAMWPTTLDPTSWHGDGEFVASSDEEEGGRWRLRDGLPEAWPLQYRSIRFYARCTPFRHLGFFPEQSVHWDWVEERLKAEEAGSLSVLNLFAYTGLASLIAAAAGAKVTHLDASKKAITYAKDNQALSKLDPSSIRWICDDAKKFVSRELRRGARYHGIILDPPKFGRGAKGEVWKFFEDMPEFLLQCAELLHPHARFFVVTSYAIRASFLSLHEAMAYALKERDGLIESGEMTTPESATGRLLSQALFCRWSAKRREGVS